MSERAKSMLSFIGAIFFLLVCSLMFFPWFQWQEQSPIVETVKTLTISDSQYKAKPMYVVTLENGKMIRVKAPPLSNFKAGDEIELRLFTEKRNDKIRRYSVRMPEAE